MEGLYKSELLKLLNKSPDGIALIDKGFSYQNNELEILSQNLAVSLRKAGLKSNDRVVLAHAPNKDFLTIFFSLIKCGAIISLIDPEMGMQNYEQKLKQFDPHWCFVDHRLILLRKYLILRWLYYKKTGKQLYFPKYSKSRIISCGKNNFLLGTEKLKHFLKPSKDKLNFQENRDEKEFLVIYTSGTLSEPKGVVHSKKNLINSLHSLKKILTEEDQRGVTHLPHFVLLGIMSSVTISLWDQHLKVEKKLRFIKDEQITTLFNPPAELTPLIDHCLAKNIRFPSNLKHIIIGAAPVLISFLKSLRKVYFGRITCAYGMIENPIITYIDGDKKLAYKGKGDIVGKLLPNIQLKIAKDDEILLHSNQIYLRYWHQTKRGKWHETGDLGTFLKDGQLALLGRKKNVIVRTSLNIYPGLYEPIINQIKGVKEAVMIGIYNHKKNDEYIVLAFEGDINEKDLMEKVSFGKYSLDKRAIPDFIFKTKILHKGRQLKVDFEKLRTDASKQFGI